MDQLPTTMWAWRKHKGKMDPIWEQVPLPTLHPTGLLIKMLASGVCRSDHNLLTNESQPPWFQPAFTLGHEGCGTIVALGTAVSPAQGFAPADTVALLAVPGCGGAGCDECARDLPQLCEVAPRSGIGRDGFFAPYAVVDVRGAVKVPGGVSAAQAAVATDAVATAYHAIHRRGEVRAGDTVFLFGLGGLGFNALQVVRAIGARVLVSDVKEGNLEEAVRLGVPREDVVPVGEEVRGWVERRGVKVDVVADFVGTEQTFRDAQYIVRPAGKMLCVGTLNHDNTVHMKIGVRKRITIIFSYGGQTRDLKEALDLIARGVLNPIVVSGRLEDFPRVLKELEAGEVFGRVALLHDVNTSG